MRPRLRSSLGLLFLVATLVRVGLALLYPIDVAVGATMPRDGIASRHISVVRDGNPVRVRPGQVLVPEGKVVTEEDLAALRKGGLLRRSDEWQRAFADVAYFLLLAILAWMAVARHGDPYPSFNRQRPFLVTLGVGMVLLEGALSLTGAFLPPIYRLGLPLATALLVLLVLAPFRFALLYSVFLLYLLVPLLPGVTVAEIAGLLAALGAAVGIRDRHRIRLFDAIGHFILFLWLLSVLVAISLDGMEAGLVRTVPELVLGLLYAGLTGVIVFALATGMLVLARRVHGLSTPDSLVETSAPDHPLLRQLAAKAPGTMAHVRAVQEIAEAGAAAVAAASGPGDPPINPWVVRAGALFHDVGKIVRPHFFSENQAEGENPHEDLSPKMSARLLISHVPSGVEAAEGHGLPEEVVGIIRSHHGTSLAGHFFNLAEEQAAGVDAPPPDDAGFRYPGPLPRTPEEVLVMLADTAEATSRSLRDLEPPEVRARLEQVLDQRAAEGQFRESIMTLAQFDVAKDAVLRETVTRLHRRPRYRGDG